MAELTLEQKIEELWAREAISRLPVSLCARH